MECSREVKEVTIGLSYRNKGKPLVLPPGVQGARP
jgi:hypothetical protein